MTLLKYAMTIFVAPITTWRAIATEKTTPLRLYLTLIIPLSAIRPLAENIQIAVRNSMEMRSVFSLRSWSWAGEFQWPPSLTVRFEMMNYLFDLLAIGMLAVIADMLAPFFLGQRNRTQAFKVIVFSFVPTLIGALFIAIPVASLDLSMRTLAGVYLICLLPTGLSVLMKSPYPRAFFYAGVMVIAQFGIWIFYRAASPTIMSVFFWSWRVLTPVEKQNVTFLVGMASLLSIVAGAIFMLYGKQRKTN